MMFFVDVEGAEEAGNSPVVGGVAVMHRQMSDRRARPDVEYTLPAHLHTRAHGNDPHLYTCRQKQLYAYNVERARSAAVLGGST